ncbi:MAG: peptide deformylase [Candidatus Zixiibacteriota bacterium]
MAERPIVKYGDPVLREISRPVETVDQGVKDLVSDMTDTLNQAQGLGLAAVQIGVPRRVFLVDLSAVDINESLRVFINPEIVSTSGAIELEEGCLSFPGIYQKIVRPAHVTIRALDVNGQSFEMTARGMVARAILHEYDHLEGKLFIDYISPIARTLLKGRLKRLAAAL